MNRRNFIATSTSTLALGALLSHTSVAQTPESSPVSSVPPVVVEEMSGDDPLAAAEHLSILETTGHIPALYELYGYIHPDAAEIVPRATVIGWYQEDFQPLGPQPAVATGVEYIETWTWGVTGKTYNNVAEVSYTQEFTNRDPVEDVVRLIYLDGSWRWWFGRNMEFVEEQNERFANVFDVPEEGVAPNGLDAITAIDEALLAKLPGTIDDSEAGSTFELMESAGSWDPFSILSPMNMFNYVPVEGAAAEYPIGSIYYGTVQEGHTDADAVVRLAENVNNAPPAEIVAWNSVPESGPAWLQSYSPGAEMGPFHTMQLVLDGMFIQVSMQSEQAFIAVIEALAGPGE